MSCTSSGFLFPVDNSKQGQVHCHALATTFSQLLYACIILYICTNPASAHNYIYLEIIIRSIVSNRYLHVIHHYSIAIHSLSTHQLLNQYLAELPAILDIFPGIANATTTTLVVVENHKVVGNGYVNTENSQIASISVSFSSR